MILQLIFYPGALYGSKIRRIVVFASESICSIPINSWLVIGRVGRGRVIAAIVV